MKQGGSPPSYSFLFLGRSSGVWRRTAPDDKHSVLLQHLHIYNNPRPKTNGACVRTEHRRISNAGHQQSGQKNISTCSETTLNNALIVQPALTEADVQASNTGLEQVRCPSSSLCRANKGSCSHARNLNKRSVLTMLLEDPGDCFIHMLLQFGTAEVEAALKGDQTNNLC